MVLRYLGSALALTFLLAAGERSGAQSVPERGVASPIVVAALARYRSAIADDHAAPLSRYARTGTLSGAGLTGTLHSWNDGDRSRDDETLGPRSEEVLDRDGHLYLRDSEGSLRELTGVLLRRHRTERFIDSGAFADAPERCVDRGTTRIGDRTMRLLDVTAPGGQTETLYLDEVTGLPARLAYDDDDGRTTVDLDDWHTVAGHRFPFRAVISNGDHPYDITEQTTAVQSGAPIAPSTFDVPVRRTIDIAAPETVPLETRQSHLYTTVRINGEPYSFLIDSGSAGVLLDQRIARAIGLRPQGALEASGVARTGGIGVARLAELAIGSGRLHDLVVSTLDLGGSTRGAFRIDGILGYPFFAQAMVRMDPANGTMTVGPPGSLATTGARIPLELDRALPEATLRLNTTVEGQFVVDTGDSAEVLVYRPFVDQHPGIVPFSTTDRSSYGLGGSMRSYRTVLDELTIGGIPLYHLDADVMLATRGAFADRFSAGNVGLGVLRRFIVTLDEANAALYLEKGAQFDDGRYRYR